MANLVLRYLGLAKEGSYGEDVGAADLHIDIASASLDSPSEPNLVYEGGIGRMPGQVVPGPYVPAGGVEGATNISVIAYLLDLALGVCDTNTDNEGSPASDSFTASGTTKELDLTGPIIQGSFTLDDNEVSPAQVAHDNGWGKIVEDASSGISGWINYATGAVHLEGLEDAEDYGYTSTTGYYTHTITPGLGNVMPSFNAFLGKDLFEHVFLGCIMNQLDISVEQEFLNFALDVQAQKDKKATIKDQEDLMLVSGCHGERLKVFADMVLKMADYGSALADVSAKVRALSLTINNNATTEENIGLGSRFPQDGTAGAIEISGSMTLQFEDTTLKEDFWGDSNGAVEGDPQLKALEITIDAGGITEENWGDCVISLGRVQLQAVDIQPSGREKLMQEVTFQALYDCDSEEIISAVVRNFNRLHNPAS